MKHELQNEITEIISNLIHAAKCEVADEIKGKAWEAIDSKRIAKESIKAITDTLQSWLYIPCCHTTGMHDPCHFEKRTSICDSQKGEAFERFCKDLGVNPETKSTPDCSWCRDYLHYRKGEGLPLFAD